VAKMHSASQAVRHAFAAWRPLPPALSGRDR
jgi:hypothetical protein